METVVETLGAVSSIPFGYKRRPDQTRRAIKHLINYSVTIEEETLVVQEETIMSCYS
jgi:hypothetical protein